MSGKTLTIIIVSGILTCGPGGVVAYYFLVHKKNKEEEERKAREQTEARGKMALNMNGFLEELRSKGYTTNTEPEAPTGKKVKKSTGDVAMQFSDFIDEQPDEIEQAEKTTSKSTAPIHVDALISEFKGFVDKSKEGKWKDDADADAIIKNIGQMSKVHAATPDIMGNIKDEPAPQPETEKIEAKKEEKTAVKEVKPAPAAPKPQTAPAPKTQAAPENKTQTKKQQ